MSIEAEVFEQAKKRARRKGFLFALLLILSFGNAYNDKQLFRA